ncbi:hypothetical protein A3Q56_06205 [Intoshia linei]|uniref:Uncharacterized protein n=1 Tax=Intoshia linei TaxID=1819745 RepID=A0A177AVR2_9BILA|nr:hypothetical protein A3Q56_06205 [Intoshia linei]
MGHSKIVSNRAVGSFMKLFYETMRCRRKIQRERDFAKLRLIVADIQSVNVYFNDRKFDKDRLAVVIVDIDSGL